MGLRGRNECNNSSNNNDDSCKRNSEKGQPGTVFAGAAQQETVSRRGLGQGRIRNDGLSAGLGLVVLAAHIQQRVLSWTSDGEKNSSRRTCDSYARDGIVG